MTKCECERCSCKNDKTKFVNGRNVCGDCYCGLHSSDSESRKQWLLR